jgi:hypothetical protein
MKAAVAQLESTCILAGDASSILVGGNLFFYYFFLFFSKKSFDFWPKRHVFFTFYCVLTKVCVFRLKIIWV